VTGHPFSRGLDDHLGRPPDVQITAGQRAVISESRRRRPLSSPGCAQSDGQPNRIFIHRRVWGQCPQLPRVARRFQHDVPVPPLDAASASNLDQRPIGLRQTSPAGAGSKAGLDVMPIDSVTLSDGLGLPSLCELRRDSPRLAQAAFDRAVDEAAPQARVVARGEVHRARGPLPPG